ncbi:MAG: dihydropteroate synthase [Pseudomonadota bacterium]
MLNDAGPTLWAGHHRLDLAAPAIMGVLNLTTDSFSDGGQLLDGSAQALNPGRLRARAEAMVAAGAAILDLGAESSRPGAEPVAEALEADRIHQALAELADLPVILSVDTRRASVADLAIDAGATLINDIGGGRDPAMRARVAGSSAAFCIMHMQGSPASMQDNPSYVDVVQEVGLFLNRQVEACEKIGIERQRLLIDPGFGFGKTLDHNLTLLRHLDRLIAAVDAVCLVGLSRKRMIGALTGQPVDQREHGSVAAALMAVERGARILRVHDVRPTADALAIWSALREQTAGS